MTTVRLNSFQVFIVAILLITPTQSHSLSFSSLYRFRNVFSFSHSIFTAVAKLRAARGDVAGAKRATAIANVLDIFAGAKVAKAIPNILKNVNGFGFLKLVWSVRYWNWTLEKLPLTELYGVVSDINEFLRSLTELTRVESVGERSVYLSRNYQNLIDVTKSLSGKILQAFGQSEVVREVVETLRIEVVEGELIKDCLLVGGNDLKDLINVAKDLLGQFFPATAKDHEL